MAEELGTKLNLVLSDIQDFISISKDIEINSKFN
jgi:hypothetical protein